jgi:hypothetical protein
VLIVGLGALIAAITREASHERVPRLEVRNPLDRNLRVLRLSDESGMGSQNGRIEHGLHVSCRIELLVLREKVLSNFRIVDY